MAKLKEPIVHETTRIRNVHFFNGRLLTGEDMRAEQTAQHRQHAALALALGPGVVSGLEVNLKTRTPPVVTVSAGRAINRLGQVLELAEAADLTLQTAPPSLGLSANGEGFITCPDVTGAAAGPTFTGAFLLTIEPVFGFAGRAPKHETFDAGTATGCGTAYEVQGLLFRLVELELAHLSAIPATRTAIQALIAATGQPALSRLRNLLAHACLGTEDLARFATDPFAGAARTDFNHYGALDRLRDDDGLDDAAVPLALTYWNGAGLQFVDLWSVRRETLPPNESPWAPYTSPRRVAEGQAAFQQFQLHVGDLLKNASVIASSVVARDYFRYLPAAGLVPVAGGGGSSGFNRAQFFSGMTVTEPVTIEGRQLRPLFEASYRLASTDLDAGELHWLYAVRENASGGGGGSSPPPYVVFANGLLPYQGNTQQSAKVLLLPIPDPVHVGDELTALGAGFILPVRLNTVAIGTEPVEEFNPGTSPTKLVFNVPEIPGLAEPRILLLSVSNANGAASTPLTVLPPRVPVPEGTVLVTPQTTDLGEIETGETYTVEFQVDSQTDIAETYALGALYSNIAGASKEAWEAGTAIRNDTGTAITSITVTPGIPRTVRVAVTVPGGATRADLRLNAASINNPSSPDLTKDSTPITFEVGSTPEVSDPRVQFERFLAAPPATVETDPTLGTLLRVPRNQPVLVQVTSNFDEAGTYTYTASVLPAPATGWTTSVIAPADGESTESADGEQSITVSLTTPSTDTAPQRTLEIRATRAADPAIGQDAIASWFRIPVQFNP